MSLKQVAIQAVKDLVNTDGSPKRADKIEKRFKIFGCFDYYQTLQDWHRAEYVRNYVQRVTTWEDRLWLS